MDNRDKTRPVTLAEIKACLNNAINRQRRMKRASAARQALPIGSSRARITTANANHANACEAHDKARDSLEVLMKRALENGLDYHN